MNKELGKKLMNIRERAIKDGMKLLSEEEILDEKCSRCKQLRTENERLKRLLDAKESPLECKYSGDRSIRFWDLVNNLPDDGAQEALYFAGVLLQNMEEDVLRVLGCEIQDSELDKKEDNK